MKRKPLKTEDVPMVLFDNRQRLLRINEVPCWSGWKSRRSTSGSPLATSRDRSRCRRVPLAGRTANCWTGSTGGRNSRATRQRSGKAVIRIVELKPGANWTGATGNKPRRPAARPKRCGTVLQHRAATCNRRSHFDATRQRRSACE